MIKQGYGIVLSELLWLQCVALMDLSSLPSIRCGMIKNKDAICYFLSTFFMNIHVEEFGFSLLCKTSASLSIWGTLYNVILRIARNLLETKENIKIESHPFYHIICDWFSWGWSKKMHFLPVFELTFDSHKGWATSMPYVSINCTNPRTNP
jgi:hypothetical protein